MGGWKREAARAEQPGAAAGRGWPTWARRVVSAALLFHLSAILVGVLGGNPPKSLLEHNAYLWFKPYYDLVNQGHTYSYYAPDPPPTPVAEATLRYGDGRPDETVRLPKRGAWPRLNYQRQLALSHWLHNDFEQARAVTGDGSKSRWAHSYARHLCATHPGCTGVTLHVRIHDIPDLRRILELFKDHPGAPVDLDADEFYEAPERIGDYPCDD